MTRVVFQVADPQAADLESLAHPLDADLRQPTELRARERRNRRPKISSTGAVDVEAWPSMHNRYRDASSRTVRGWQTERSPRRKGPLESTVC